MNPTSMWCLQDLFSFCAFALLLHIGIFVLYITRARTYYHGPSDVVKRVANIFLGAFPTGLATVLIFSLVVLLPSSTHNRKEKKRKDYAFWRQFNEKPSILLGCPASTHIHFAWCKKQYDLTAKLELVCSHHLKL